MGRKSLTQEEVVQRMNKINPNIKIIGQYINNSTKIECECLIADCRHKWLATPYNLFNGYGCPECGKKKQSTKLRRSTEQYKKELKDRNIQIECLDEYKNANIKILHKCLKHNIEWMARPYRVLNGETMCPQCKSEMAHKRKLKSQDEFIKQLHKVHPNIDLLDIYNGGDNKHKFKCNVCGYQWDVMPRQLIDSRNPSGCPVCASSKLEKKIKNCLDSYNIYYKQQYRINECRYKRPLPFDFAIFDENNDLICLIEADGQQHFRPVCFAGISEEKANKNFKEQQIKDGIKNNYCKINNIKLLRISYLEINNIESCLIDKLHIIGGGCYAETKRHYKEKTCA